MSLRDKGGARVRLAVKVVPRASRDEIVGWLGDRLKLKVTAPPTDGRANEALEAFLAAQFGLPRRNVRVATGHTSTSKVVEFDGLEQQELLRRVDGLLALSSAGPRK